MRKKQVSPPEIKETPKVNNEIPEKSRGIIESSNEEKGMSKQREDQSDAQGSDSE